MKRAHDISEITVTFLSEGIVIPDSRISRLKTPSISSGVSVVQANAGTPGIERKCREGKGGRRIADGEEIEKERVSYYRDNWRNSKGE